MNKKKLLYFILCGIVIGVFIIQPLAITLQIFDIQGDYGSWGELLLTSYQQVLGSWDLDQTITKALFGLFGVTLSIIYMFRQKIFKSNSVQEKLKEIKKLIETGENQQVEFKSTLRWDLRQSKTNKALEYTVAKTIAGFMNTQGGHLFIGIDDDGNLLGLQEDYATLKKPDRDSFEQYIMQLVSTKLGTNFCSNVEVSLFQMDGVDICHLFILKSDSPVYLRDNDRSYFYIRTGNGTRELDIPEALKYINKNLTRKK